jgi:signal transduction histidine kinase
MILLVVRNLLTNSINFTLQGGKVDIFARESGKEIQVSIADTGIGISQENLSKLFQKQEHSATLGTQNEKGTGLGLSLCKEFVEANGGKIWAE